MFFNFCHFSNEVLPHFNPARIDYPAEIKKFVLSCQTYITGKEPEAIPDKVLLFTSEKLHAKAARGLGIQNIENIEEVHGLLPTQRALQIESEGAAVNNILQTVAKISVDPEIFKAAWEKVVATHSVLRSRFVCLDDEKWYQVVLKEDNISWSQETFPQDYKKKLEEELVKDANLPFDLTNECLSRVAVYTLPDDTSIVIWSTQHVIMDAWSSHIIIEDLLNALENKEVGKATRFSQVVDYFSKQEVDEKFWKEYLQGLPENVVMRRQFSGRRKRVTTNLPDNISLSFEDNVCFKTMNPAAIIHTCWALVLSFLSSSNDVTFGTLLAGRDGPFDRCVGCCVSLLPFRCKFEDATLQQFVKTAKKILVDLSYHQHTKIEVSAPKSLPKHKLTSTFHKLTSTF